MEKIYEINKGTYCLIQNSNKTTTVLEEKNEYEIEKNIHKIVDDSCRNFGSSLKGRVDGTINLTGIKYKSPIVVSEYLSIIMIPTGSTRGEICHWISLSSIKRIERSKYDNTIIVFNNDKKIELDVSYFAMQNQFAKATRLDYNLRKKYDQEKLG